MKVLLILPAYKRIGGYDQSFLHLMPPLGIQVIASLTPDDVEVQIIDENVEPVDFDHRYDLVGISSVTTTASRAYEISTQFRKRGTKVIMGGIHPTVCPEEAGQYSDSLYIGEGEILWHQVISDVRNGKLATIYKAGESFNLDNYPKIKKGLINKEAYVCPDTIETSRGCPFSCDFCSISVVYGKRCRYRPIEDVINQLLASRSKNISFVDDNIVGDFERSKELFSALEPLSLTWGGQASLNMADDDELLRLAKQSGCKSLFIGVESNEEAVLKNVNKFPNVNMDRVKAIQKIQDHGISVFASFVNGFDWEDKEVFKRTLDYLNKASPQFISIAALTPFPGTKLYDTMNEAGRMKEQYWLDGTWLDRSRSPFSLRSYSDEDLRDGLNYINRHFFSYKAMIRRLIKTRINIFYYTAMSLGLRSASLGFQGRKNILFPQLGKMYSLYKRTSLAIKRLCLSLKERKRDKRRQHSQSINA